MLSLKYMINQHSHNTIILPKKIVKNDKINILNQTLGIWNENAHYICI